MDFGNISAFYFKHNTTGNCFAISSSTISFYELTVILEGSVSYVINGKPIKLFKGDILFLPKNSLRERPEKCFCKYLSFNFYTDREINCFETVSRQSVDTEIQILVNYFDEIKENNKQLLADKCSTVIKLMLIALYEKYNGPKYCNLTKKIIKLLKDSISGQLTIKDIENKIYFSKQYMSEIFKKDTGLTIMQYFTKLKVEQAKFLLSEGFLSLTQISTSLGYDDYNYFSRIFRKATSYSPMQFKSLYYKR